MAEIFVYLFLGGNLLVIIFYFVTHVRCRRCAKSLNRNDFLFAFKKRRDALVHSEYLGESTIWMSQKNSSHTVSDHRDAHGHNAGTSHSTTSWYEQVPYQVSTYRHDFICPDCRYQWSTA